MSSLTDFLFNGSPPPATTTYGTATTGLPQWYSDYQQGILSAANGVAAEPYQQYGGQRVAGLTTDQNAAVANTRAQTGDFLPGLNNANSLASQAAGTSAAAAGATNLNAAAGMSGIGAANPYLGTAAGMNGAAAATPAINGAMQQNGAASAAPWQTAAAGQNGAASASPWEGAAAGQNGASAAAPALNAAAGINATGAAQSYANQAGPAYTGIANYMNPYNDAVTNRIGELAARNLNENLMPAIGDDFTKAGQFGSSRMQYQVGNALRDTQESALAAQNQALQQGFNTAASNAQSDASRAGQLAGTMGSVANQQQSNLGQLANTYGNLTNQYGQTLAGIGQTQGNLTNAYGNTLAGIGQTQGALTNQYGSNLNQAGQTLGSLTGQDQSNMINAGQVAGSVTNQGQANLANIGQTQGNLASADSQNLNSAAKTTGSLAQQLQTQNLADNAALQANGTQQQNLDQLNLNTAYQDFLNQVNYPKQQVGFLSDVAHGIGNPGSATTTTQTAPAASYQPSGLASIAGSLSTAGALSKYLG